MASSPYNIIAENTNNNKKNRTDAALHYLRKIKPLDGWSVDTYISSSGRALVMLRRRNIPLVEGQGFEEIVYDDKASGRIVGVTSYIMSTTNTAVSGKNDLGISSTDLSSEDCRQSSSVRIPLYAQGLALVESDGTVIRNPHEHVIRINLYPSSNSENSSRVQHSLKTTRVPPSKEDSISHRTRHAGSVESTNLSDEQIKTLLQYGLMIVGVLVVLKIALSNVFFLVYVVGLPLFLLYALQTCPKVESFDAKKELKRVMRGAHLPQEQQPQDWLTKAVARVQASIGTELATSFGYEVSFLPFFGICTLATVRVPIVHTEYCWLGIFDSWRYLMARDIDDGKKDSNHTM